MAAPIIAGIVNFTVAQLADIGINLSVWEGEVPRQNTTGQNIIPPVDFPCIRVTMTEDGLERNWTMADAYYDEGPLRIQIWDTTRSAVESMIGDIEAIYAEVSNWQNISLPGGPIANPYYVIDMLLGKWTCVQEEGVRTQASGLIYRGDMNYSVRIHGAISTLS